MSSGAGARAGTNQVTAPAPAKKVSLKSTLMCTVVSD